MAAGASKRALVLLPFILATAVAVAPPSGEPHPARAEVLISAGHEGRPESCHFFSHRPCNLGTPGEREATPIVADEATRALRAAGIDVLRLPADYGGRFEVRAAIFIHFDGAVPACSTGASIGYPAGDGEAARAWRQLYAPLFPFRFMPDNFTESLSHYYGFRTVEPNPTTLVLELGELTCPVQHLWLKTRYKWLGDVVAHFVSERLGKGNVPLPPAPKSSRS
ncbi:MAG: hypothetical protein JO359_01135 [Candidatus Eremiobacteraeota bacterium]|nr:hypothetical protein [Candidatus Eremiobacteraeota bacterium]